VLKVKYFKNTNYKLYLVIRM